jgi:thioester reductase-like protein
VGRPITVTRILEAGAAAWPDRGLFSFYDSRGDLRHAYTYGAFLERSRLVAAHLHDKGLSPGQVALLVYPPGIEMAAAFFACARIGAIPAPAPTPSRGRAGWTRLAHIAQQTGAAYALTTTEIAANASEIDATRAAALSEISLIATDSFRGEAGEPPEHPSDILFLQYTSGSVSAPRGVAVSHANVIHNAGVAVDHDHPIGVTWLPHFHDMGLLGYFMFSMVRGGEAHCFAPHDFLRRPLLWFEMISRHRATITSAPNAAYEYCLRDNKISDADLEGVDLGSLRTMMNCAEPVRATTFERFRRRYARHGLRTSAYVASYGLAEHTLCVTTGGRRIAMATRGARRDAPLRYVSCGKPAADIDLRIVAPETQCPVADGAVGEIWIDSASKAMGYWRQPEASLERFQASVRGEVDGRRYLRTGDLGFLRRGELFVCGRISDMIVLNGRNVFPDDIEAVLEERFPKALAGHVVAFGVPQTASAPERLVILVEAPAGVVDLKHLIHVVQEACDAPVSAVARVTRGSIIRTSSGKIARQHCRAKWENGSLEVLETAASNEGDEHFADGLDGLVDALASRAAAFGDANATLDQLGLDSIALVDLSIALEAAVASEGLASPALIERVADLSLLQALRVPDLKLALSALRSGAADSATFLPILDRVAEAVRQGEQESMRADSAMPLPEPIPTSHRGTRAFLTGPTGFLGAHLLKVLIEQTDDPITVLVRCRDRAHGLRRLTEALLDTDMPAQAASRAIEERITLLAGDLTLPHLGLADEDWQALAANIGRIYHAGADVDYVKSYALLRPANVIATREIIALATMGCRKELHHVSTTFVHGWSTEPRLYERSNGGALNDIDFGYAQSKYVAEQLVRRASGMGLDATIYRPALVTASSTGRFVARDIVARVLGYMLRYGLTIDLPNQVSFLPVDVCANNIVAISRDPRRAATAFHMTADDYYTIGDVCRTIANLFGYRFDEVSLPGFVAHAHAYCAPDDPLYPLLSFLDRNTGRILRMGHKRYISTEYQAARRLAASSVAHPNLRATVEPIVAFLRREGLVPQPPAE